MHTHTLSVNLSCIHLKKRGFLKEVLLGFIGKEGDDAGLGSFSLLFFHAITAVFFVSRALN